MEAGSKVLPKLPGQVAIELLREYKRTEGTVSHFPDDKRREIVKEIQGLVHEAAGLDDESPLASMKQVGAERNKQIFLAYLQARIRLLEQIRWEVGMLPDDIKEKLSKDELNYYEKYNSLVANYIEDVGIDLTQYLTNPPIITKDQPTVMEVRVLKDEETTLIDGSTISLTKDKRLFLDAVDAEPLIRRGTLEHII